VKPGEVWRGLFGRRGLGFGFGIGGFDEEGGLGGEEGNVAVGEGDDELQRVAEGGKDESFGIWAGKGVCSSLSIGWGLDDIEESNRGRSLVVGE